jgi:hypothetical protein
VRIMSRPGRSAYLEDERHADAQDHIRKYASPVKEATSSNRFITDLILKFVLVSRVVAGCHNKQYAF